MTDEEQTLHDFLKELGELSKKHGVCVGKYPHFGAPLTSMWGRYLGYCWPEWDKKKQCNLYKWRGQNDS